MNSVIENIISRRSTRNFKSEMLPKNIIDEIINAGLWAASGKNRQSTIIIAVTNKELRDKISKINCKIGGWDENFDPFYGAPVILIVLADKQFPNKIYDGSLVMANLMLAANSLGIGSCWINRAREEFEMDEYKNFLKSLGITGDYEGIGHCALGYIAEETKAHERKPGRVYYVE